MPQHSKPKIFNFDQIQILDRAWVMASSLVADNFRLDFNDFHSWPVDIKRYIELTPEERAEGVFAQLFRYLRPGLVVVGGRPDYYRICLYDPTILRAVEVEPDLELDPLLIYVLTHEFIHVARFVKFMKLFALGGDDQRVEEEIVHQETFRLLQKISRPDFSLVLNLYQNHRLPVD